MSASNYLRGDLNWHRLHCDVSGCVELFVIDERYGHLERLREIARDAGWSSVRRHPVDVTAPRRSDFCPRHSPKEFPRRCRASDAPDVGHGPCHQEPGHSGRHQDHTGYEWDVATEAGVAP